jgi:hypothetical protein
MALSTDVWRSILIPSARSLTLKFARISQLVLTKLDNHTN